MKRLSIGDKVRHDFSKTTGIITDYRNNPQGYNYQVKWEEMGRKVDWFTRKVLEIVPTKLTPKEEN